MAVLFISTDRHVCMVVNYVGYLRLRKYVDYEASLVNEGMDPVEARAIAGYQYPHPPMISFFSQLDMPLKSRYGRYGHGGHVQLLQMLIKAGNHVPHQAEFPVYNSSEWDLPLPRTEDFVKIFGRTARKVLCDV